MTAVLFSVCISPVFALSSDEKEQAKLVSDSAICRRINAENICTYYGNARFNQGTTNLQAEQIAIYKKAGKKIHKMIASGKKSHYSATLENKQKIDATADSITIYLEESMMILEGNGAVVIGEDKYSGPYIKYKIK